MAEPYQNTISGLLKKRAEVMGEATKLREAQAVIFLRLLRKAVDFRTCAKCGGAFLAFGSSGHV